MLYTEDKKELENGMKRHFTIMVDENHQRQHDRIQRARIPGTEEAQIIPEINEDINRINTG